MSTCITKGQTKGSGFKFKITATLKKKFEFAWSNGSFVFVAESYTQAVNNPVTPSLRALKTETPPTTPAFQRKKHGIRASLGKGLMKLRGHKSSSEPNLGDGF